VVLIAAAVLLIKPGYVTDAIGLALLALVYASNRWLIAPAAATPAVVPEETAESGQP
jgi:UPF0716 family protein affecting phage T7 exclusion